MIALVAMVFCLIQRQTHAVAVLARTPEHAHQFIKITRAHATSVIMEPTAKRVRTVNRDRVSSTAV